MVDILSDFQAFTCPHFALNSITHVCKTNAAYYNNTYWFPHEVLIRRFKYVLMRTVHSNRITDWCTTRILVGALTATRSIHRKIVRLTWMIVRSRSKVMYRAWCGAKSSWSASSSSSSWPRSRGRE